MKHLYLIITFLSIFVGANAQQWAWAKDITLSFNNPTVNGLVTDNNSNYYVSVNEYLSGGCIVKFDTQGNELWRKYLIGDVEIRGITCISNYVFITGVFTNTLQIGNDVLISKGQHDAFIAGLDINGSFIWAKNFGGSKNDYGNGICSDTNGNIYLTGEYSDTANFGNSDIVCQGSSNMFMAKLDLIGNILLLKSAGCQDSTGVKGSNGLKIKTDMSGNIFILGYFTDIVLDTIHIIGHPYYGSYFLSRFDSLGNAQWGKEVISSTNHLYDFTLDQTGNILAQGAGSWTNGGWIITHKYSSVTGQLLWNRTITGSCYGDDYSSASIAMENNNCYLIGTANRHNCLPPYYRALLCIKYDSLGNIMLRDSVLEQTSAPNGSIFYSHIVNDTNGDFIVCGTIQDGSILFGNDLINATYRKLFITKFYGSNSITATQNIEDSKRIDIFPNPSFGIFTINLKVKTTGTNICVYDVFGKCVYKKASMGNCSVEIDLSSRAKGVYFIEILSDSEKNIKRIVLQ
ncbi:MAG: T9SS type A sorting domain-containing protein [Bacteroidota bacterium]